MKSMGTDGSRERCCRSGSRSFPLACFVTASLLVANAFGAVTFVKEGKALGSVWDLVNDPLESTNVLDDYPNVGATLHAQAESHRKRFFPKRKSPN